MNFTVSVPARPKARIFNPHRLKANELEESFIARQELFQSILGDLAADNAKGSPQHHLVIGQRGMGKTTLLRRLALELHREPCRQHLLPLNFPEEQYVEVDRLSKFWLNCLDSMADALESEGDAEATERIDDEVKRLSKIRTDETTYGETCRESFSSIWKLTRRRPVLFIDNFNLLLGRLKSDDYSLRGYFSAPGAPILVAASTVYPEEMQDYGAAFYDGFKTHYLYPLSLDEVRDVLIRLAKTVDRPGLVDRIYRETPRLATLRDLTGGNPRTAVLLFELFADGFSEDAFEDLDALLDMVTPLYQSRLDQLSDLAQTIVGTLARNWSPMSKADIVSEARLVDSSVPPQLLRLKEIGLVEETALFPSKKTGYQIAERFFNIWYLMRFASRRQRADLACLTRFLEEFHTPSERSRSARELVSRAELSRGNITYAMALAPTLSDAPGLRRELEFKAQRELIEQMEGVRDRIAAILDPNDIPEAVYSFVELRKRLENAAPKGGSITGREFADLVLGSPSLVPDGAGEPSQHSRAAIATAILLADEIQLLQEELEREVKALGERFSQEALRWIQERLIAGTLRSWKDAEALNAMIELADDPTSLRMIREFAHPKAKHQLADTAVEKLIQTLSLRPGAEASSADWFGFAHDLHSEFGRARLAEMAYQQVIHLDPDDAYSWHNLGTLLENHLSRYEEAEHAYRQAIRLEPDEAYPWTGLGNLLQHHLSRYEEAEHAYRRAIRLGPDNAYSWFGLGNLLHHHLSRYEEAEHAYQQAIRLDSVFALPWTGLGNLLRDHLCRFEEAEHAYREAIRIDSDFAPTWNALGNMLLDYRGDINGAHDAYDKAIACDNPSAVAGCNLGFLHRDYKHDFEAANNILNLRRPSDNALEPSYEIHEALFAAYDGDWKRASALMKSALKMIGDRMPPQTRDDWFRASAVLIHLGFGSQFVALLHETGADRTMLPWFAAVQSHVSGDKRHLVNLPLEARPAAEKIFDEIECRRKFLPKWEGHKR